MILVLDNRDISLVKAYQTNHCAIKKKKKKKLGGVQEVGFMGLANKINSCISWTLILAKLSSQKTSSSTKTANNFNQTVITSKSLLGWLISAYMHTFFR